MTPLAQIMAQGLLLQVFGPLQFMGFFYRELRHSIVDMQEYIKILQTPSNLPDGTHPIPATAPGCHTPGIRVELRDVVFGYSPDRPVLRGVSMVMQPGQSVAIVGPSGSGKSTILKLLTRLYDVQGGSVLINGVDMRDITQASLRADIAVVPQETTLFNDTIAVNIAYGRCVVSMCLCFYMYLFIDLSMYGLRVVCGCVRVSTSRWMCRPNATEDEVQEASRLASLHGTVLGMPEQYETMVGERGLKLSGGEKQRVAIARAFLKRPRLLICAWACLDT